MSRRLRVEITVWAGLIPALAPAAAAGVRPDDVITELHDHEVRSEIDYWRILRALVPGTQVTVRLSRGPLSLVVSGSPIAPPALGNVTFEVRLGITLGNAAEHADRLKLDYRRGAVILHAVPGASAFGRNLRSGDVIVGLEAKPVQSVADLNRIAKTLRPGASVHLIVARGKRIYPFTIKY